MGFNPHEVTAARANVPEGFQADPNAHLLGSFAEAGTSDEPGAEQQERNAALRAKHDEQDDALIAKASGVLGASRMDLAGVGAAEDRRIEQAGKDRAKARHETNYLAALQAQLDQLNADITQLDIDIENILDPYLSEDEKAYLDGIDDPEEKAREQMRIAREKLENGEMSQAEFDRFEDRWDERQAKRAEHERVENIMENGSPEERRAAAINEDINSVRESRDVLEQNERIEVEQTLESRADTGNAAKKSAVHDDLGGWGLSGGKDSKLADLKGHAKGEFKDVAANTEATNPTPDDGNHPPSSPLPSGDKLTLL
ncbi:hypothetical protein KAJ83_06705 [Marivibrio halodurans]|uniref:Uncharacterized protein n=1 Tax=Marivibrio halodurans TaxID=2039722 RepID=A0A8J7V221_9PROT|nr:hypothetical protein [Marivibrio halodurans]MBP5856691.1 hypothetical protein [Marivibrio halodurans]